MIRLSRTKPRPNDLAPQRIASLRVERLGRFEAVIVQRRAGPWSLRLAWQPRGWNVIVGWMGRR